MRLISIHYLVCKNYIENRYRRFFPTVIAAGIIMFILQLQSCITKIDIMKRIYEFVVQASFLSQIFAFLDLGVGGIFWFLSASIFGGALVLFVCKSFGKKAVPLLVVFFSIIIHVPFFERHQSGYETQLLAFRFF